MLTLGTSRRTVMLSVSTSDSEPGTTGILAEGASPPTRPCTRAGSWPRCAPPCSPSTSTPRSSTSRCRRSRASSSAGTRQLQWVVDGYNLAFAGLVLAAGSLSDRFGRRPALITGLVGFAAASAAGALVTSADALVAARFVMGAFAALIFPTTLSIISNTFRERRERAAALGIWGAVVGRRRRGRPGHRRRAARALLLGQRLLGAGPARAGDGRRGVRPDRPSRATRRCRRSTCPASGCRWRCWPR